MVAAVLAAALLAIAGILLGWWDWKTLIGWRALVDYIDPQDATDRKDVVQVYALIVAGLVAAITAAVGLANLYFTRKNLNQQRDLEVNRAREQRALEDHRAQSTALQDYFEQMGKLLTEHGLVRDGSFDIRLLARAQTLTVLEGLDPPRKNRLMLFLIGSDLVQKWTDLEELPLIDLSGADLHEADLGGARLGGASLSRARLGGANLGEADLSGANLSGANLVWAYLFDADLSGADLSGASLVAANLFEADLRGANLSGANLSEANLSGANLSAADLSGAYLFEAKVTAHELVFCHEGFGSYDGSSTISG